MHYESFLHKEIIQNPSTDWHEARYKVEDITEKLDTVDNLGNEDFMLRNTYLNSLAVGQINDNKTKKSKRKLFVKWLDKGKNIKTQLEILNEKDDLINKSDIYPVTAHVGIQACDLKSAIKGSINEKSNYFKIIFRKN